jgi:hypothetical protein
MAGLVFFRTEDTGPVIEFYTDEVGADVWLEQPGCTILEHGKFRFGFCERDETENCGIITFYYDDRETVDEMYDRLEPHARGQPEYNETYDIYQFFAEDPDGRTVEFQTFEHPLPE